MITKASSTYRYLYLQIHSYVLYLSFYSFYQIINIDRFSEIGPDTYITITQKGEDLSKEFLNGYRFG